MTGQKTHTWQYNGVAPWNDIIEWCYDSLYKGESFYYEPKWWTNNGTIYFEDSKEYTQFLLRWSC